MVFRRTKEAAQQFGKETKKQIGIAVNTAFALLIALTWKDVISEYINKLTTQLAIPGPAPLFQLYSALITTLICVIGIILASKWDVKIS